MRQQHIYGWFDDSSQASPTYDPPRPGLCLYCGAPWSLDDVRTHSLMMPGYGARSYFYRTHRTCDDAALSRRAGDHEVEALKIDDIVFEMIARNGD